MRRRDPIPLADALAGAIARAEPGTPLAVIQRVWRAAVGETIAGWATPAAYRDGLLTVHCGDSVTAHELTLMQSEISGRLNEKIGDSDAAFEVNEIRFRAGKQSP